MKNSIVAFLQNPWFPAVVSDKVIIKYRDDQDFHQRVLARTMTGRRLVRAFGDDYHWVWWDNANWRASRVPSGMMPPDCEHIRGVVERIMPRLVITFGRVATEAVMEVYPESPPVWSCPHPNARGIRQEELNSFAALAIEYVRPPLRLTT